MGARQIRVFIVDSSADIVLCPQDALAMLRSGGTLGLYGYDPQLSIFRLFDLIGSFIRPVTDSANAIQVQNAAGTKIIGINTLFDNPLGSGLNLGQIVIGNQGTLSASVGLMNEMVSIIENGTTTADLHGLVVRHYSNDSTNGSMSILKSRGATPGAIAALLANDFIATLNFYGDDGNLSASPLANPVRLRAQATENWSTTGHGSKIFFTVCTNGTTSQFTGLTIDHDGTIYAGTSSSTTTKTGAFSAQTGSGTDNAGSDCVVHGGAGTGAANGGVVRLQAALPSASGSSLNTYTDATITGIRKPVSTNGAGLSLFKLSLPTLKGIGGEFTYTVFATDGVDVQTRRGMAQFSAVNKGGAVTTEMPIITEGVSVSAGTLTATVASVFSGTDFTVQITPTSSLTPTTYWVQYTVINNSGQPLTLL